VTFNLDGFASALADISFADLSDMQTVGIGLYLALAVIQVVTDTGVAGLRRRASALKEAVNGSNLRGEFTNMHTIGQDIERLEIGFRTFSRLLFIGTLLLFVVALFYFAYCTIYSELTAGLDGTTFTIVYYLVLPLVIFALSSLYVSHKCREVRQEIEKAEKRYHRKVLS